MRTYSPDSSDTEEGGGSSVPRLTAKEKGKQRMLPEQPVTALPSHVMDMILGHVSFDTLLAFRATCKDFRYKIDKSLRHLIITERQGPLPFHEMTIYVYTANGYHVLTSPSHMCMGDLRMPNHRHRPDEINHEARKAAQYLYWANATKKPWVVPDEQSNHPPEPTLVIDIVGGIPPNCGGRLHFLADFIYSIWYIKEIRHIPDAVGSLPSTVFVPWQHDIVVINDWLAPPRTVYLSSAGPMRQITYRLNDYNAALGTKNPLVNTVISCPAPVVYDFTQSIKPMDIRALRNYGSFESVFTPPWNPNLDSESDSESDCEQVTPTALLNSKTFLAPSRPNAVTPGFPPGITPVQLLAQHAARCGNAGAATIAIQNCPAKSWLGLAIDVFQAPSTPSSWRGLSTYDVFREALEQECGRQGTGMPRLGGSFWDRPTDGSVIGRCAFAPTDAYYRKHKTLDKLAPKVPMIVVTKAAGKEW